MLQQQDLIENHETTKKINALKRQRSVFVIMDGEF
jgi:hypothetical protein